MIRCRALERKIRFWAKNTGRVSLPHKTGFAGTPSGFARKQGGVVRKSYKKKYWIFTYKQRRFRVLLDKVLLFRYLRRVHGRFWGLAAVLGMSAGFVICFIIRPDMLDISTAFSDFALDVRTAPYFAGSVFFGAYGLWRWRNYLSRTWKRKKPVLGLVTLTIIGLYLVALMPLSWKPWPYRLHLFGVTLAGISMLATVLLDWLLSRPRQSPYRFTWRALRLAAIVLILTGGWLTIQSTDLVARYHVSLLGESLLLTGYGLWIGVKTSQGEGSRSTLSKFLKDFVLVD